MLDLEWLSIFIFAEEGHETLAFTIIGILQEETKILNERQER
jgi:hypothetical protein